MDQLNNMNNSVANARQQVRGQSARDVDLKKNYSNEYFENYQLGNNNATSYRVIDRKQTKRYKIWVIPSVIVIAFIIFIVGTIKELRTDNLRVKGIITSDAITLDRFRAEAEDKGLNVSSRKVGKDIKQLTAITDDISYEISMMEFKTTDDASKYYSSIRDSARVVNTMQSSEVNGEDCGEMTFVSNTYNGFMDVTYIDNTIIVGIAYNSNEQKTIVEFMNKLGY